jgi:ABC-type Fe3+/spermidine/putrescine transport system ATPase subunit
VWTLAELRLIGVKNPYLKEIDFHVAEGEAFSVVGPSGAGKTSLLRVIAGLSSHEGRILLNGKEMQGLPADRRSIGFVSQDLHLFPHMTLEENILLVMNRSLEKRARRRRANELMALLRINNLSKRKPMTFSGGEKQRAALARVLASEPRLLLLDEPFSKLDFRTARYLRSEFRKLRKDLNLTTVIVTHNLEEADYLGGKNRAIMKDGSLTTSSQWENGADLEKEEDWFLEPLNVIDCRLIRRLDIGLVEVAWAGGRLMAPDEGRSVSCIAIKGREIDIGATPPQGPDVNRFCGVIKRFKIVDDSVRVSININGAQVCVEESKERWMKQRLTPGMIVYGYMRMKLLEVCP